MEYKGIILAGGSGTRLWPITSSFSKHFIPVFDKPMIYYPLTTLILAGVKEVLIICNSTDKDLFKSLLSNGKQWGIKITYELQAKPRGIAEALIIAEDFIDNCSSILILGDNFLYGPGLGRNLSEFITRKGAAITAYEVSEPSQFGVVVFDKEENPTELIEKPEKFISKWAIPGIYFYDKTASERAKLLKPSNRGELEITELNRSYLEDGQLKVHKLPRGTAWLDLGTSIGILEAGSFVRILQDRQGILVGSPHEAALQVELISKKDLVIDLKDQKSNYAKKIIDEIIEQF
jgi:glucose-1-phosphate thymidylyltransferase